MESGDKSTEKDLKNKYRRVNASCALHTLARLIQDPMTTDMIDRQLLLLEDLIFASPCGFWVQDLQHLNVLLGNMLDKHKSVPSLTTYIKKLLNICMYPPLLMRQDDILLRRRDVEEYFTFLGYILVTSEDPSFRILIIEALWSVLERKMCIPMRCISLQVCYEAIENSSLPEILSDLVELYEGNLYTELLKITLEISKISEKIRCKMLKENILNHLMTKLDPNWQKFTGVIPDHDEAEVAQPENIEESLLLLSELVKTLSDAPEDLKKEIRPPGITALLGFRYCLRILVVTGKKVDCNFCLSILLKVLELFPNVLVYPAGLIDDICILAVASEFGTAGTWAALVPFGTEKVDFVFKRSLLVGIFYCIPHLGCDNVIEERNVISALLKLITPQQDTKWCSDHTEKLRLLALTILERILVKYKRKFFKTDILTRLLNLIESYTMNNYIMDILIAALKCVNSILLMIHDLKMMRFCFEKQANGIFQGIITHILETKTLTSENQIAMYYTFNLLNISYATMEYQVYLNLKVCLSVMQRTLSLKPMDIRCDPRMMVSCLTCLWTMCSFNDDYCVLFCDNNGVYTLLDVIKDAQFVVKIVGLGLLVDMCAEGTAIPYMVSWRNDNMNLMQMLLQIFREENALLEVKTTNTGIIFDTNYPLMGKLQKQRTEHLGENDVSPAITDMELSCRPKIYAIINLLSVVYGDKVSVADEYYKISYKNLSTEDKVTKLMCENFLALKMGEAWAEVHKYFENLNIELVEFDNFLLETMLQHYKKYSIHVQKLQDNIVHAEKKNEYFTEEEFYKLLREGKLAIALEALNEIRHIARTTESIFRLTNNIQNKFLLNDQPHTHRTFNALLPAAEIQNQKLKIQSDIVNSEDPEPPELVSPISDSVCIQEYSISKESSISTGLNLDCEENDKARRAKQAQD